MSNRQPTTVLTNVDLLTSGAPGGRISRGVGLADVINAELALEIGDLDELVVCALEGTGVL